jgi:hypothetical protein
MSYINKWRHKISIFFYLEILKYLLQDQGRPQLEKSIACTYIFLLVSMVLVLKLPNVLQCHYGTFKIKQQRAS